MIPTASMARFICIEKEKKVLIRRWSLDKQKLLMVWTSGSVPQEAPGPSKIHLFSSQYLCFENKARLGSLTGPISHVQT